jgi:hypothetical protein
MRRVDKTPRILCISVRLKCSVSCFDHSTAVYNIGCMEPRVGLDAMDLPGNESRFNDPHTVISRRDYREHF